MAASIVMAGAAADTSDPDHRRLLRGRRVHLRQERGRVLGRVDGGVHGGVLPATYSEAADTHADAVAAPSTPVARAASVIRTVSAPAPRSAPAHGPSAAARVHVLL